MSNRTNEVKEQILDDLEILNVSETVKLFVTGYCMGFTNRIRKDAAEDFRMMKEDRDSLLSQSEDVRHTKKKLQDLWNAIDSLAESIQNPNYPKMPLKAAIEYHFHPLRETKSSAI